MKITPQLLLVATAISCMAVSCQKEAPLEATSFNSEISSAYIVRCTINGVNHQEHACGKAQLAVVVSRLMGLAECCNQVTFQLEEPSANATMTKDVVKHTTKDKENALDWCTEMALKGYRVTIQFDEESGEYTCIAQK